MEKEFIGYMKRKVIKKSLITSITVILMLALSFTVSIPVFASEVSATPSNSFSGGFDENGDKNLEDETNSLKNEDGTYTTPVSTSAPQITFLIPGYGSEASVWSNNYVDGILPEALALVYNEKSFVEAIREYTDANIYVAKITTEYPNEKTLQYDTNGVFGDELDNLTDLAFNLYRFPEFCKVDGCSGCDNFHTNLEEFDFNAETPITYITDSTKHNVILFEPADATGSHAQIYEQFNYVADKIVYNFKVLNGGVLPRVNLIAHSRGSVTALEYAMQHPYITDSMFTMGGVFNGSFLGQFEPIINLLGMSKDKNKESFSFGVADILNPEVYGDFKDRWNEGYEEKYSHINFHAIGGAITFGAVAEILKDDDYNNKYGTNIIGKILGYVDTGTDIEINDWKIGYSDEDLIIYDDLFIHVDSQLAEGYTGVTQYLRVFEEDNMELNMVAQANTKVPHNLEPGDPIIHAYILEHLSFGNESENGGIFKYNVTGTNSIKITGLHSNYENTPIAIPATIDGYQVVGICPFAFAYKDIQSVSIPASVTEIGEYAFYGCESLTTVNIAQNSALKIIGKCAFAGCTSLVNFTLPASVEEVYDFAFASTAITSITLSQNVSFFSSSAFVDSALTAYSVADENSRYTDFEDVLYNYVENSLVSYPCKKPGTSFVVGMHITTLMPYSMSYVDELEEVELQGVTHVLSGAFMNSESLSRITAPNLTSAEADSFSNTAFINSDEEIKALGEVLIKYSGTAEEAYFNYHTIAPMALYGNDTLKRVTLGPLVMAIREFAFFNCSELKDVYIMPPEVINISDLSFDFDVSERKFYVGETIFEEFKASEAWADYSDDISMHTTKIKYETLCDVTYEDSSINFYGVTRNEHLPMPTRVGYTFAGWSYIVDGQVTNIDLSTVWPEFADEVTFTANWTLIEYKVTLVTIDDENNVLHEYYTIESSPLVLEDISNKVGYTFCGWYDNTDYLGERITVIPTGSYGDKFFFAKWTQNSYTLTLNYNYDGSPAATSKTVAFGESFTLPVPERAGYYFNGWRYNNSLYTNSSGNSFKPWDIVSDSTLYADWTKESYYIKINVDGTVYWLDEDKNLSETEVSIEYGTLFGSMGELIEAFNADGRGYKTGYLTSGFSITDESGNEIEGLLEADNILNDNMLADLGNDGMVVMLEPQYQKERYKVIFSIPEDLEVISGLSNNTVFWDYDDPIVYETITTYSHLHFGEWKTKDCEENEKYNGTDLEIGIAFCFEFMPDLSEEVESDSNNIYTIILEPVLIPKTVTIAYNTNSNSTLDNTTIAYNKTIGTYTFDIPTKNGYQFLGWYDGNDANATQYSNSNGVLIRNWDIGGEEDCPTVTLYAKWKIIEYTITYVLNDGTNDSGNPSSYTVETATINLLKPSKAGYKFVSWHTNEALSSETTGIEKGSTGNKTFYAEWERLYKVTFVHGNNTIVLKGKEYGEIITVPSITAGYIFENSGISQKLESGASYTVIMDIVFTSREKDILECYDSSTNTYKIYTYNQLKQISDVALSGRTYVLQNNIQLSVSDTMYISNLRGTLDGNGHVLKYVRTLVISSNVSAGSYGLIKNNYGTVKNLTIDGLIIDIKAPSSATSNWVYAGFIAGTNYGTIQNCSVKNCEIIAPRNVTSIGGIAGINHGGTIKNCNVENMVFNGYGNMAGIAGTSYGGTINNCAASEMEITLSLNAQNSSVGGIVAHAYNGAKVTNCRVESNDMYFGTYTNINISAVQPNMGYVIGNLTDSTATGNSATNCTIDSGNLPTQTGTIFNRHYPCANIKGYANGMIGYASNSTY